MSSTCLDNKLILDATAGFRMMWFDKHDPDTLYIDEREECKPDILMSWRDLSKFPTESFKLIVFDPPHFRGDKGWHNPNIKLNQDYGLLKPETWPKDISNAFTELWRCLKIEGVLLFKWNDHDVKFDKVLSLLPIKPLFGQQVKTSASKHHPCSTIWFCFMKKRSCDF